MAWERIEGKSRRYRNTETKQEISDYAMRALRTIEGERSTFSNFRLAQQRSAQARYNSTLRTYVAKEQAAGKPVKLGEARKSEDFRTKYAKLSDIGRTRPAVKTKIKSRRKIGTFDKHEYFASKEFQIKTRRVLKDLGKREGIPDWVPVGLSAEYRSGKLTSQDQL